MKIFSIASIGTIAVSVFLFSAAPLGATTALSVTGLTDIAGSSSIMTEVKCVKVNGELKCGKKHQSQKNKDDKETKTVKLIKQQDTCSVHTPGLGGSGCSSPLIHRCDKLKDGDEVCCCYKVDTSE